MRREPASQLIQRRACAGCRSSRRAGTAPEGPPGRPGSALQSSIRGATKGRHVASSCGVCSVPRRAPGDHVGDIDLRPVKPKSPPACDRGAAPNARRRGAPNGPLGPGARPPTKMTRPSGLPSAKTKARAASFRAEPSKPLSSARSWSRPPGRPREHAGPRLDVVGAADAPAKAAAVVRRRRRRRAPKRIRSANRSCGLLVQQRVDADLGVLREQVGGARAGSILVRAMAAL